MATNSSETVEFLIMNGIHVVEARRRGLEMAMAMGFVQPEAIKIAVVISELARNIHNYAGMGYITLTRQTDPQAYLEIVAQDAGPGIPNINKAMQHGYSTSRGMGVGLPGCKQLMDEFEIHSRVGLGTTVKARKWLR
jgi:serine/threonine-protein kinase RsbT